VLFVSGKINKTIMFGEKDAGISCSEPERLARLICGLN
jgi:hypothetical protein